MNKTEIMIVFGSVNLVLYWSKTVCYFLLVVYIKFIRSLASVFNVSRYTVALCFTSGHCKIRNTFRLGGSDKSNRDLSTIL